MSDAHTPKTNGGLPENAYKELKPGEEYVPIMISSKIYPEVNMWSVTWDFNNGGNIFCCCCLPRIKDRTFLKLHSNCNNCCCYPHWLKEKTH